MANVTDTSNYTIDLLQHASSGEKYVAKTCSVWADDGNGDCVGHEVVAMSGPLHHEEIEALRSNPENWDADGSFDLTLVNQEVADQTWTFAEELQSA